MRHSNKVKKLSREANGRRALIRTLAVSLIEHGRIQTTAAKAIALRPFIERIITKTKVKSVTSKKYALAELGSGAASVMDKLHERSSANKDRAGGYTRILKLPERKSDGAPIAIIEFVQ